MAKVKYPPQAGEKKLCLTLFCFMMIAVMSSVAIIYSIVIIYIPSIEELQANFVGPKMCTTIETRGNVTGQNACEWQSCQEWCLASTKTCSHVYAAVRELGTQIYWDGCEFAEDNDEVFIDHTCHTLEHIDRLNCKLYSDEKDSEGNYGHKENCTKFDKVVISCESGLCKEVSQEYACEYKSKLEDIREENNGRGDCQCNYCGELRGHTTTHLKTPVSEIMKYVGDCIQEVNLCYGIDIENWNSTLTKTCGSVGCFQCRDICHFRGNCFDLRSRKDPTKIGTDKYAQPVLTYYECRGGYCSEIYDLKCERKCSSKKFNTKNKNSILFIGERVIMAKCAKRHTVQTSSLDKGQSSRSNTIAVTCTNITLDREAGSMISEDCVNGVWFENNFNNGQTNYSYLTHVYNDSTNMEARLIEEIALEEDLIIFNRTRMLVNMQGCVNTLQKECTDFFANYGGDGRNHTARAVYQCYYDPDDPDFAVINFDPEETLLVLICFIAVPFGLMIISCGYLCICSRFIHVADDGHMRLRCCGKYVTGIGNVPRWDPPNRRGLLDPDVTST